MTAACKSRVCKGTGILCNNLTGIHHIVLRKNHGQPAPSAARGCGTGYSHLVVALSEPDPIACSKMLAARRGTCASASVAIRTMAFAVAKNKRLFEKNSHY